jgi:hypothetical protein
MSISPSAASEEYVEKGGPVESYTVIICSSGPVASMRAAKDRSPPTAAHFPQGKGWTVSRPKPKVTACGLWESNAADAAAILMTEGLRSTDKLVDPQIEHR